MNVLKTAPTPHFAKACDSWLSEDKKRARFKVLLESQTLAAERNRGSEHQKLITESIKIYAKNFLRGYRVLYQDFSDGDRISADSRALLDAVGAHITVGDVWPDVTLHNPSENSLWFIEAVTSDGEVDGQKWEGLKKICERAGQQFAGATTTYADWTKFASRQRANKNLHIDSRVWISEDPTKEFVVRGPEVDDYGKPTDDKA